VTLSVVIITHNEEANLGRTLASVKPLVSDGRGEVIVVDSGSTDRTVEIAKSFGAKVFVEEWKGYAAQKNSAIDKATGDWILSLDADEEVDPTLAKLIPLLISKPAGFTETELENFSRSVGGDSLDTVELVMAHEEAQAGKEPQDRVDAVNGYWVPRKNHFLGRWIKHGGFWPDPKLRLFRRGYGRFEGRSVHETVKVDGYTAKLKNVSLIHHSYPTLSEYIEHMNRYSSLGAETVMADSHGKVRFSIVNTILRPLATFVYNYFFRLGFLDGREGLLLHIYHSTYVSWKYAKAWEMSRTQSSVESDRPVV
jgi:glycosyltransferase involved in cell wall biosynthesis